MQETFSVGEYIYFWYDKKEKYPGRIISIQNEVYTCEICTNKRKSAGNDLEIVRGSKDKLEKRII